MKPLSIVTLVVLLTVLSCSSTPKEQPPTASEAAAGVLLSQGLHREALEAFSAVAYEGAGSHRALVGMALCYAHLGDRARFEVFSLEASEKAPGVIASFYRLGVMYVFAAERFREGLGSFRYAQIGLEYLRRVFAAHPNFHPDLIATLGLGLHLAHDDAGAAVMLEEGLKLQPDRVDILHTLLLSYRNLKQKDSVKKHLKVYAEEGDLPPAWQQLWLWANKKKG